MKFKRYNQYNSSSAIRSDKPHMLISLKNSAFTFNASAINLLELKEGKKIEFLQSSAEERDWFIALNSPEGFVLKKRKAGGFIFSSKPLVLAIIESLQLNDTIAKSVKIPIADGMDPEAEAYALLTSTIKG